jgi:hypothetical protein
MPRSSSHKVDYIRLRSKKQVLKFNFFMMHKYNHPDHAESPATGHAGLSYADYQKPARRMMTSSTYRTRTNAAALTAPPAAG